MLSTCLQGDRRSFVSAFVLLRPCVADEAELLSAAALVWFEQTEGGSWYAGSGWGAPEAIESKSQPRLRTGICHSCARDIFSLDAGRSASFTTRCVVNPQHNSPQYLMPVNWHKMRTFARSS
jgi:hypothetical protein